LTVGAGGFLFIDKPAGPSSFAVVSAVRRAFRIKRVGHGGTLDPAASGLLAVALGSATRLLPYAPLEPKRYLFGIRFGVETDTLDSAGTTTKSGGGVPSETALRAALPSFCGRIMQVPPDYSAVKIDGVRAYRMARAGKTPVIEPRRVEVHSLSLLAWDEGSGEARLEASCSGGTYVRSLARDIAAMLGTFGHAHFIRRTALGPFLVATATPFDKCNPADASVVSPEEVLRGVPRFAVGEELKRRIVAGCDIPLAEAPGIGPTMGGPALAVDLDNAIVAVMEPGAAGYLHPVRVFPDGSPPLQRQKA
jgi:tRNA pseudouridine55 synthase